MSYILNALRKSEAQRRLGQNPDLHSAMPVAPRRSGRGRLVRLALGLVVVVAAAGTGVWLWQDDGDRLAESRVEERSASDTDTTAPEAPGEPEQLAAAEASAEEQPAPAAPVSDRRSPPQPAATVVSRPAPRRPGEVAIPAGERERLVSSAEEAQRLIEAQLAEAAKAAPSEPAAASVPAATAPAQRQAETPAAEPDWAPERNDALRAWELPLAVRRELPGLNLSIHVFSAEPAARFVLINGERRMEGEDLGEGATLVEIRRDGAIINFRDYRFLLEP